MSNEAFLEESASLRSHLLALHAFSTAAARVAGNAMAATVVAAEDIERTAVQWTARRDRAAPDVAAAEESLATIHRWQELVHCETLLFFDQVTVYRDWMREALPAAHRAILDGLCVFAKAHSSPSSDEDDMEECEDDELVYVNSYVHTRLPPVSEIPACDSIGEAVQRLEEIILPALREDRAQLALSWQSARADWLDGGATSYEINHYAEIDRASQGFEHVIEALALGLGTATRGLPPAPRR